MQIKRFTLSSIWCEINWLMNIFNFRIRFRTVNIMKFASCMLCVCGETFQFPGPRPEQDRGIGWCAWLVWQRCYRARRRWLQEVRSSVSIVSWRSDQLLQFLSRALRWNVSNHALVAWNTRPRVVQSMPQCSVCDWVLTEMWGELRC